MVEITWRAGTGSVVPSARVTVTATAEFTLCRFAAAGTVTVSSVAGLSSSLDGGYAHYGAAKAAILHYTRYLAQDLGPFGINANCIAPVAKTRMSAAVPFGTKPRPEVTLITHADGCACR